MTQFAIPTSDPVATLTFEQVLTIDISSFTGEGDYISLSLPEFPITKVDLTETFVDFTSNAKGNFGIGPTDQIAFSEADPVLPSIETDVEMRIPIKSLINIDKTMLTGVRFRIKAVEECDFRCLAIRACSEGWQFSPIDLDTLWHRVHRPPSPNGAVSYEESLLPEEALLPEEELLPGSSFVKGALLPSETLEPSETLQPKSEITSEFPGGFPTIFRSNLLQGLTDPEPVNLSVGTAFTTGSLTQAREENKNEIALYFRDIPTDNQTMIEVDSKTMADLDSANAQPDFGKALFDARDQEEIDLYVQGELDERTQFMIERKRDESEHTWMEVRLKWGEETATNELTIHDADERGYKWTNIPLEASKMANLDAGRYILITTIEDSMMRAQIYKLNQIGEFASNTPVFDTGEVRDDTLIKRRRGRFGWFASLLDGDAHIDNMKTRGTNFGEMITKEFRSVTPVRGVQVYSGSTVEKELISGFERTDTQNMKLTLAPSASAGGKAVKVEVAPLKPLQGIASNTFLIDDPTNIRLSFDIKFPSTEIPGGGLSVYLLGSYQIIYPVNISGFSKDTWTHVKCSLPEGYYQTGGYKLLLIQSLPVVATAWYVENLSARTYTVKWSARPHASDAWDSEGERWLEAGFTLNSLNGGIVFPEQGNGLQVRAQALRQDAVISDFKAIPQYATLGNIVFED